MKKFFVFLLGAVIFIYPSSQSWGYVGAPISSFYKLEVKPEAVDAFVALTTQTVETSLAEEEGLFEFYILVDKDHANVFYFFEVYQDQAAGEAHYQTPHFKNWWGQVGAMLTTPIEALARMTPILPDVKTIQQGK